jgi:hypothetical protein
MAAAAKRFPLREFLVVVRRRSSVHSRCMSGDEHPTSSPDRPDAVGTQAATDPDDEGVATTLAQIGDPGSPGQLAAAEHAAGVGFQDVVHSPLLRCQILEGVRIRLLTLKGTHRSGLCHVHMQVDPHHTVVRSV